MSTESDSMLVVTDSFPNIGYVYSSRKSNLLFADVHVSDTVSLDSQPPPWIVVASTLSQVSIYDWPGRLWRVRVIQPAPEADQIETGRYVRASVVEIVEELPLFNLFGKNGAAVYDMIQKIPRMTQADKDCLASRATEVASEAYSQAWNRWFTRVRSGSPINQGFYVISSEVERRAFALDGDTAFIEDEGERSLEPTWAAALHSCLYAAIAYGAPDLVSTEERQVLLDAWESVSVTLR